MSDRPGFDRFLARIEAFKKHKEDRPEPSSCLFFVVGRLVSAPNPDLKGPHRRLTPRSPHA